LSIAPSMECRAPGKAEDNGVREAWGYSQCCLCLSQG
jgi:hypothetical protein